MFIQLFEKADQEARMRRIQKDSLTVTRAPLIEPPAPSAPAVVARGVYEEEIHPAGEHWYKVVTSLGHVAIIHLPDELWDPSMADNLRRRLDAKDPVQTKLKAI